MSVQGYSQRLPVLLGLLLDQLASFSVRPDRFAVVAEHAKKEYANLRFGQVRRWAVRSLFQAGVAGTASQFQPLCARRVGPGTEESLHTARTHAGVSVGHVPR